MNVRFIEQLREAAVTYGAVADLLSAIRDGLLIDGVGNKEIVASDEDLQIFLDAQIAAEFSEFDRGEAE